MIFPSNQTIVNIHRKYAPHDRAFNIVYGHCQIIAELAEQVIEQKHLRLNKQLVQVAALLHDVGYYPLFDKTGYVPKARLITHGVIGAEILRKEGFAEEICRIAERHTGIGLTREYILQQKLPLPTRNLVAETPEEWLIMYVDKLHTKALIAGEFPEIIGWFVRPKSYLQHAQTFGRDNAERFARLVQQYGIPDLQAFARKYEQEVR